MQFRIAGMCGLLLLLNSPIALFASEMTQIRIPQPRSPHDTSHLYFTELLQKALAKAANGRELPQLVTTMPFATERMVRELRAGRTIDIFWLGGSRERARDLLVVPIPLERGLLGYRQFIIRKERVAEFDSINTVQDLAHLKACQGAQWADTDVLRAAHLNLITSVNYESLFKQLSAGRCDYFPRGFNEAKAELARRAALYPDLMVYEPLILHYPFAAYFFVHKDNKVLALWLQEGLEKMIDDGELLAHMQQHEHTSRAFPLSNVNVNRILLIPNYYLPNFSNQEDMRYWFQPSDFRR
jgi:Bacterial extracellular solute-binding proteins, family 3